MKYITIKEKPLTLFDNGLLNVLCLVKTDEESVQYGMKVRCERNGFVLYETHVTKCDVGGWDECFNNPDSMISQLMKTSEMSAVHHGEIELKQRIESLKFLVENFGKTINELEGKIFDLSKELEKNRNAFMKSSKTLDLLTRPVSNRMSLDDF